MPARKTKTTPKPTTPARKRPTIEDTPEGMAWCSRHQAFEPAEEFARDKSSKSGLYGMCKAAEAEWRKQRAAALAAGATRVIRKGSPGYVAPEAEKAPSAAPRKRSAAPKASAKVEAKAAPRSRARKPTA